MAIGIKVREGSASGGDNSSRLLFCGTTKGEGVTVRYNSASTGFYKVLAVSPSSGSAGDLIVYYSSSGYSGSGASSNGYIYIDIDDITGYDYAIVNAQNYGTNYWYVALLNSSGTSLVEKRMNYGYVQSPCVFKLSDYAVTSSITLRVSGAQDSGTGFHINSAYLMKELKDDIFSS